MQIVKIPRTIAAVAECWSFAEAKLREAIDKYAPNSDEESITRLFHLHFAETLTEVSGKNMIARAFLNDLKQALPNIEEHDLARVATGLVGDVTLHNRQTEKITGSDMGLVLIRPQVSYGGGSLSRNDYRRGLLCQAKLKKSNKKWGGFTTSEEGIA